MEFLRAVELIDSQAQKLVVLFSWISWQEKKKKKKAITSNDYIQKLRNVYDDHPKKSYWVSQIKNHIKKNTLLNKQYSIAEA